MYVCDLGAIECNRNQYRLVSTQYVSTPPRRRRRRRWTTKIFHSSTTWQLCVCVFSIWFFYNTLIICVNIPCKRRIRLADSNGWKCARWPFACLTEADEIFLSFSIERTPRPSAIVVQRTTQSNGISSRRVRVCVRVFARRLRSISIALWSVAQEILSGDSIIIIICTVRSMYWLSMRAVLHCPK